MARLSETPVVHPTAKLENCILGRYTEVAEGGRLTETELGDYSYAMEGCQAWCVTIAKFANIAASVRINATHHPMSRPTLHHITYRASDYFDDAEHEAGFFAARRARIESALQGTWLLDRGFVGSRQDLVGAALCGREPLLQLANSRALVRPADSRTLWRVGRVFHGSRHLQR